MERPKTFYQLVTERTIDIDTSDSRSLIEVAKIYDLISTYETNETFKELNDANPLWN
ncbi:MAG: hypothetical protein ACE5ES_01215 [Candidatus Nanoarchaeia archaeon]